MGWPPAFSTAFMPTAGVACPQAISLQFHICPPLSPSVHVSAQLKKCAAVAWVQAEPSVLPARVPNLLVNGSSGIAVGIATKIPPHNLGEVVSGLKAVIANPDITVGELMRHIPAPDFPTGAAACPPPPPPLRRRPLPNTDCVSAAAARPARPGCPAHLWLSQSLLLTAVSLIEAPDWWPGMSPCLPACRLPDASLTPASLPPCLQAARSS